MATVGASCSMIVGATLMRWFSGKVGSLDMVQFHAYLAQDQFNRAFQGIANCSLALGLADRYNVEIVGNGYARTLVSLNPTNWSLSSLTTLPYTAKNIVPITFASATAGWGNVNNLGIYDPVPNGVRLQSAPLGTVTINAGDALSFAPNGLQLTAN